MKKQIIQNKHTLTSYQISLIRDGVPEINNKITATVEHLCGGVMVEIFEKGEIIHTTIKPILKGKKAGSYPYSMIYNADSGTVEVSYKSLI